MPILCGQAHHDHDKHNASLHHRPSAGKVDLVPTEQLLTVCIADICVDVVIVKNRAQTWVREHSSVFSELAHE